MWSTPHKVALALSAGAAASALVAAGVSLAIADLPAGSEQNPEIASGGILHDPWSEGDRYEAGLRVFTLVAAVAVFASVLLGAIAFAAGRKWIRMWLVMTVLVIMGTAAAVVTDVVMVGEIESFCIKEKDQCFACEETGPCGNSPNLAQTRAAMELCANVSRDVGRDCFFLVCDFEKLCEETPPLAVGVIAAMCLAFLFSVLTAVVVWCAFDVIAPRHERQRGFYRQADVQTEAYGDGLDDPF